MNASGGSKAANKDASTGKTDLSCQSLRSLLLPQDCYAEQVAVGIVLRQPDGTQMRCGWHCSDAAMLVSDNIFSPSL